MGLPLARTTRDIDFPGLMPGNINSVERFIREIGSMAIDDGLIYKFDDFSIEAMAEDTEYPGIRIKFDGWLGKARIPMQIDVGFGDVVVPDAREMTFPTLPDMDPPIVNVYSVETIIAEKYDVVVAPAPVARDEVHHDGLIDSPVGLRVFWDWKIHPLQNVEAYS